MGHTPRSLIKTKLGDIIPAPFGPLHRALISSAPSGPAAPFGCRSGFTTLIGATAKAQRAVQLGISSVDEGGEPRFILRLQPSSVEQGLDERRLRLQVSRAVPAGHWPAVKNDPAH